MKDSRILLITGPPASGKSALIQFAKKKGYQAYDFELMTESEKEKIALVHKVSEDDSLQGPVLVALGEINPLVFNKAFPVIFLLPSPEIYLMRLEQRDAAHPEKAGQNAEHWYGEFVKWKHVADFVIENDTTMPDLLDTILAKYATLATL
ncbi:MAG: hypothetical protein O3B64_00600 [bacterium]|nr:hypothetical protein [bacterium]